MLVPNLQVDFIKFASLSTVQCCPDLVIELIQKGFDLRGKPFPYLENLFFEALYNGLDVFLVPGILRYGERFPIKKTTAAEHNRNRSVPIKRKVD